MKKDSSRSAGRVFVATVIPLLVLLCAVLISVLPGKAHALSVNIWGDLDGAGPFGGTGLESGRFSGTFTIDPSAVDQYDSSQPDGDKYGIYTLSAWSIDFYDASNTLQGQLNNAHGGTGRIDITQDPAYVGTFGNIGLDFEESYATFTSSGLNPTVLVLFGAWFNSASIITDALPTDFSDATYTGDGLIGLLAGGPDLPATFLASASLSTPVPEPATMLLLVPGLAGLAGFGIFAKRRRE